MKICLMSSFFEPLTMGGLDVYMQQLAEKLSKNHEVLLVATCPYSGWGSLSGKVEQRESIKVVRFFPLNLYHYYSGRKPIWMRVLWSAMQIWNPHSYAVVKGILEREKPDIVHSHTIRNLSPSVLSAIHSLGIPHIHTLHDYELLSPGATLLHRDKVIEKLSILYLPYTKLMRLFTRNIKAVTAGTQFVLDTHSQYGFFKKAKKYVIPVLSGVPDSWESNKDYETLDILFVGEVSKRKGIHILLSAFTALNEPNIRLHIVGQGPLAQQVSSLTSQDARIKYYGYVPQGESLWKLYAKANLFVFPSIWFEPQGIVSIEAFSFGIPVVGSAIGGIPETVDDGYNGLLFKPGDVEDLARTLKRALSDTEMLKKLGENARKSAQRYNLDSHLESLSKVYKATLK